MLPMPTMPRRTVLMRSGRDYPPPPETLASSLCEDAVGGPCFPRCPTNTEYHVFVGNFVANFVENGRKPTKFWENGFLGRALFSVACQTARLPRATVAGDCSLFIAHCSFPLPS